MIKTLTIACLVVAVAIIGSLLILDTNEKSTQAKAEAIRQADNYHPTGLCTQAFTRAVHKESGAIYTFNNGCLPPGWEAQQ
jgi:hypothetical protein